jgi:hypothetical protein
MAFSLLVPHYCNQAWLLKNHSPENGRKNFALGSPMNDVLSFPRHFLSLQFGGLGRKWGFSTATRFIANHPAWSAVARRLQ